jgi:predicted DNA-binding protein (UPF0251 family)
LTQSKESDFVINGGIQGPYELWWPNESIKILAEQVKPDRDDMLTAMITVISLRPSNTGMLWGPVKLNMQSTTGITSIIRSLDNVDSDTDWPFIIRKLCLSVVKEFQQGSPEVELTGKVDVLAQHKFLVEPIIQERNPTLIYGPGSTGKSWFGQLIAVLAGSGTSNAGLTVEPARVLYLDWETDQAEIEGRITMIRNGLGMEEDTPTNIFYKSMTSGLAREEEEIKKIILKRDITLLVLDSLGSACMGEPESADVVLKMFGALRRLGCTSLCIDHTNKEGTLFGSVYKYNQSRMVFEAKNSQRSSQSHIFFGLFHRKANNGPLMKDMAWEMSFYPDSITITPARVEDTELEEHQLVYIRMLNALRRADKNMLTQDELADICNTTRGTIDKEASRKKELFSRPMKGYVGIAAREGDEWTIS